jgi:hypothetical protein
VALYIFTALVLQLKIVELNPGLAIIFLLSVSGLFLSRLPVTERVAALPLPSIFA